MPFTVTDFHDLIRLLGEHPEWRADLRRLVLAEELLALPELVREIAETQRQMQADLQRLEQSVRALAEAQARTEVQVGALAEVQRRDLGRVKGESLERRYREHCVAYFGRLIRRAHLVTDDELGGLLEAAVESGQIDEDEMDDIAHADAIVRGRRRADGAEVYVVAEISWGVGIDDVSRAARRARLLAKTGVETVPVAAGEFLTPEGQRTAEAMQVVQMGARDTSD